MNSQEELSDGGEALEIPAPSIDPSFLIWLLVQTRHRQGEDPKTLLLWAIRNGFRLPDDLEFRAWFADVLEGKCAPKRGRGRPQKKQRLDITRLAMENGIAKSYQRWRDAFKGEDRELEWLKAEALRLRQKQPDAAVWRRRNDLFTEEGRQSFAEAVAALGACPCPLEVQGGETPRELALRATVQERGEAWKSRTGSPLTPSVVARIVARAKKSE